MLRELTDLAGVAQLAAEVVGTSGSVLVLHERAQDGLDPAHLPTAGTVLVVVGPEGGLTDSEVSVLTGAGGRATRLGSPVMRASSAGAFAVAACSAVTRWNRDRIGP